MGLLGGGPAGAEPPAVFLRGDADRNGALQLTDAVATLNFLFQGGAAPGCQDAADTDDNGTLQLTDAVVTLRYLFQGGAPPPLPGPTLPGPDPTADLLTCETGVAVTSLVGTVLQADTQAPLLNAPVRFADQTTLTAPDGRFWLRLPQVPATPQPLTVEPPAGVAGLGPLQIPTLQPVAQQALQVGTLALPRLPLYRTNLRLPVGGAPHALAVVDLDGDGDLDLVTANAGSHEVAIRLGTGDGTFVDPGFPPVAVGNTPRALAVADLNGDRLPDLLVALWDRNAVQVVLHQ